MYEITNDKELRQALDSLALRDQRTVAGLMVNNVRHLSKDERVIRAIKVAMNPERQDAEMASAYRDAKAFTVSTYTACGRDADWLAQAEHFLAAAGTACLLPVDQLSGTDNPAWRAAMQVRMAKNCEMIESGQGSVDNEAVKQYAIVGDFMDRNSV